MKKALKIIGIALLVILLAMFVTPILFKGKILKLATEQANKNLKAKVDIGNLRISLFRNFPNLYVGFYKLSVVGVDKFEGDTLVAFKELSLAVDLISAIRMENIKIKSILLDQALINGMVLADSSANWDITMPSSAPDSVVADTASSEPVTMKVALKKFEIRDATIRYSDVPGNMNAAIRGFDFILKGNLGADFTTLQIESAAEAIDYAMGGIGYAKDLVLEMNFDIDADLVKSIYTLKENSISLNALTLSFEGQVAMPDTTRTDVDVRFRTNKADFKTLLSLVPAIYKKDFESIETSGKLGLEGFVKGAMVGEITPSAYLNLVVDNARFKYPDLSAAVENINIDVKVQYNGVTPDSTRVDVNKFHLEMAGNPVDFRLSVKTPMSDMHIDAGLKAMVDLAAVSKVVPLEGATLSGVVNANVDMMGYLSYIEQEQYQKFKADGSIVLADIRYSSSDMPYQVSVSKSEFLFSPQYLHLTTFDAMLGKSDLKLSGKIEDYIPYIFDSAVIRGSFVFASNMLDLNELMGDTTATEQTEVADTSASAMAVVEVPGNVDFSLYTNLKAVKYTNMDITNFEGAVIIKDKRILLDKVRMNMLGGSLGITGEYNTLDSKSPMIDFGMEIKEFDIPMTYATFNTVKQLAPVASNLDGKVSMSLGITSFLDQTMSPVMNSMAGKGTFASRQVTLRESKALSKIANELKSEKLAFKGTTINDVAGEFEIRNGRIYVDPFDVKMGTYSMNVSGDQGIDQTVNYVLKMALPANLVPQNTISKLSGNTGLDLSQTSNIDLNVLVGNTVADPSVKISFANAGTNLVNDVKDQAINKAKEEIEKEKAEIKAKASEEAQKIIAKAEAEAQTIRDNAKKAADIVRKEADANAQKLVNEAKNPIAKKAAEASAKKIRQEGDGKANNIINEGNTKADALINKAKTEAQRLQ